jgi:hypothetical protein
MSVTVVLCEVYSLNNGSGKKSKKESLSTPPRTPRKRRFDLELVSPTPEPGSPIFWVVGKGGLGTLGVLPKEVRQIIFAYMLKIGLPITVKECCGPDATSRERDSCRRHGSGKTIIDGRFDILQVSKAIKHEASWVLYNCIQLEISVSQSLKPYLDPNGSSRSIRNLGKSGHNSRRKTAMWATAPRFRRVLIFFPENHLELSDPSVFTGRLLEIAYRLGKYWKDSHTSLDSETSVAHYITLNIGSLFQQMVPFNMESQAEEKYAELLEWIHFNYPNEEPDFDTITAESEKHLKRLVNVMGMHRKHVQWTIVAQTQLAEEDEGGVNALQTLLNDCIENGVVFEHLVGQCRE